MGITKTVRAAVLAAIMVGTHATAGNMVMGTNFWNLGWHSKSDCFNNVDNVTGTNPWNPQFLSDIAIHHHLRFMDWDQTNHSSRAQWSQRKPKSSTNQNPVAYEWMIDLCNRMDADMWVTLPHKTVSSATGDNPCDYALRLAILVKTGVDVTGVNLQALGDLQSKSAQDFVNAGGTRTGDPLDANLRVYVEYSNETWNGVFSQSDYCEAQGTAMNLDTDATRAAYKFHGWAALRLFRAFDLVFGEGSPRVVRVYAGWVNQLLTVAMHFMVQADATLNPWGIEADAIALAPYIGHNASNLSELEAEIPNITNKVRTARNAARQKGVQLFAYEGGQHLTTNAATLCRDQAIYSIYRTYLDSMNQYLDAFSHYCHVGDWGSGGAWGSMEFTGQSKSQAHKYRALCDFTEANPPTAVEERPALVPSVMQARQWLPTVLFSLDGRVSGISLGTEAAKNLRRLAPGVYVSDAAGYRLELSREPR